MKLLLIVTKRIASVLAQISLLSFFIASIYLPWVLFSSNPTLVGEKWLFLMWRSSLLIVAIFHYQFTRTQSSHLNCTYIVPASSVTGLSWWCSSLYRDVCKLNEVVNNCIDLVEFFSVRITPADFGSVLFTTKAPGDFYLASPFVKKGELPNFPTQQKATSHTSLLTPSDRIPGRRSLGFT